MSNNPTLTPDTPQMTEVRRLLQGLTDRRFGATAVALALEAMTHYDPRRDKLVPRDRKGEAGTMTYHDFFRTYCPEKFRYTQNITLAAQIMERLISEYAPKVVSVP